MQKIIVGMLLSGGLSALYAGGIMPERMGNKHDNLVRLQTILAACPGVEVPLFCGISSERVEAFLQSHDPAILVRCREILEAASHDATAQDTTVQDEELWQRSAEQVQERISALFDAHAFVFTPEEQKFFQDMAAQGQVCMVRSTGVEDSATASNAGGNSTQAGVAAHEGPIAAAMGRVVASYMSVHALKTRKAGGENLRDTPLCFPVLIQEMIGEVAQSIPVSGVAFTTNPTLSTPAFSVTEINAAYGHGEGVVGSRVATDRYYVTRSRVKEGNIGIYPVISCKENRVVIGPQEANNSSPRVQIVANAREEQQRPCLSLPCVEQLYRALKQIEAAYGGPTDVEFVMLRDTLYIVQARPVVSRGGVPPSYYVFSDQSTLIALIPIVAGTSSAQEIDSSGRVIIADSLEAAEGLFTRDMGCAAVITTSWASPLSHAAVNFNSYGVPCFYVPNTEIHHVRQLLQGATSDSPIYLDVQRAVVGHVAEHFQRPIVQYGWWEHPVAPCLSLVDLVADEYCIPVIPIPRDGKLEARMEQLKQASTAGERRELLDQIQEFVLTGRKLTSKQLERVEKIGLHGLRTTHDAVAVRIDLVIAEYQAAIAANSDRLELLFYHAMLTALLFQSEDRCPAGLGILGIVNHTFCLNKVLGQRALYRFLVQVQGRAGVLSADMAQLFLWGEHCTIDTGLKEAYHQFVRALSVGTDVVSRPQIAQLCKLMQLFQDMHVLPLWFATEWHHITLRTPTVSARLSALVDDYAKEEIGAQFAIVQGALAGVKKLRAHLTRGTFSSAAAAQGYRQMMQHDLFPLLRSAELSTLCTKAPMLVQLSALELMGQAVDCIDTAIKTVKISTSLTTPERIALVAAMLDDFYQTFRHWTTFLVLPTGRSVEAYLQEVQQQYEQIPAVESLAEETLCRSPLFSVQAAEIGSATTFGRHHPDTLEDWLMLTHQNMLACIASHAASIYTVRGVQPFLPPIMKEYVEWIESAETQEELSTLCSAQPYRVGVEYTPEQVLVRYNLPLSNHSMTFQIVYSFVDQRCTWAMQCLGQARSRWRSIADFVTTYTKLSLDGSVALDEMAGITSWSWSLTGTSHYADLVGCLAACINVANGRMMSTAEMAARAAAVAERYRSGSRLRQSLAHDANVTVVRTAQMNRRNRIVRGVAAFALGGGIGFVLAKLLPPLVAKLGAR